MADPKTHYDVKTHYCRECKLLWSFNGAMAHCCGCGGGISKKDYRADKFRTRTSGDGMSIVFFHPGCWDFRRPYRRKTCCECGEIMDHDDPDLTRAVDCKTMKPLPRTWGHHDCMTQCEYPDESSEPNDGDPIEVPV